MRRADEVKRKAFFNSQAARCDDGQTAVHIAALANQTAQLQCSPQLRGSSKRCGSSDSRRQAVLELPVSPIVSLVDSIP